ncbi:Concanavalin A-like lectin/glucanase domain containing protein [Parasponia andersonii]|uniref:Concanavalin A-like lectin/glucanase domain containing protein n=1 Tax=Parasponia andersonii TaxID=3476 RepID=A0A2P5AZT0_PARAD|nr:Concanavalin A-like lectin/glucanase domain containing protein [Parasponia andersonii]
MGFTVRRMAKTPTESSPPDSAEDTSSKRSTGAALMTLDISSHCVVPSRTRPWDGTKDVPFDSPTAKYTATWRSFLMFCARSPRNASSDVGLFNRVFKALMENLQFQAIAAREGPSRNFAAGNIKVAECSPDLSDQDCIDCIVRGCYGVTNVFVGLPSCNTPSQKCNSLSGNKNSSTRTVTIAVVSSVTGFLGLLISICYYLRRKKAKEISSEKASTSCDDPDEIASKVFGQFDFDRIRDATNDFSEANKLGQGGFGAVYRT